MSGHVGLRSFHASKAHSCNATITVACWCATVWLLPLRSIIERRMCPHQSENVTSDALIRSR